MFSALLTKGEDGRTSTVGGTNAFVIIVEIVVDAYAFFTIQERTTTNMYWLNHKGNMYMLDLPLNINFSVLSSILVHFWAYISDTSKYLH